MVRTLRSAGGQQGNGARMPPPGPPSWPRQRGPLPCPAVPTSDQLVFAIWVLGRKHRHPRPARDLPSPGSHPAGERPDVRGSHTPPARLFVPRQTQSQPRAQRDCLGVNGRNGGGRPSQHVLRTDQGSGIHRSQKAETPRESPRRNGSTPRGPTAQWNVVQPYKEVGRTREQHG